MQCPDLPIRSPQQSIGPSRCGQSHWYVMQGLRSAMLTTGDTEDARATYDAYRCGACSRTVSSRPRNTPSNAHGKTEGRGRGMQTDKEQENTHLLHHTARLELVAIRKAPDKYALPLSVDTQPIRLALWPRQGLTLLLDTVGLFSRGCGIHPSAPVACAPFLRFAIEQKVAQDPARAPEKPICPPLDPALVLVEDKDGAGGDHFALGIDETARYARNQSTPCGLEDEQGVACGLYPPRPWGLGPLGSAGLGVMARHRWERGGE